VSDQTGTVGLVVANQWFLWVLAVAFYGVSDTVTTLAGLRAQGAQEAGPVAMAAMSYAGVPGFLALKAGFVSACFLVWAVVETPGRVAIPLALAVTGVGITLWNLRVLLV
jgi:hypothetical protein